MGGLTESKHTVRARFCSFPYALELQDREIDGFLRPRKKNRGLEIFLEGAEECVMQARAMSGWQCVCVCTHVGVLNGRLGLR